MAETENIIASGVVGVGYLGKFHAEKYASSSKAKLIGIVDIDELRIKEIGRLGIGQTVVVKKQIVLAVEAAEGTDAAIERGGKLAGSGCVVVKVSKPQQDLRFDVPAVGVETVNRLHEVRGRVLAIEAGKTILLEKDSLLKRADACGISLVGVGG